MAIPQSDGSIILTTAVDTKGIKDGLNDIRSAVGKLNTSIKTIGQSIAAAFGLSQIIAFSREASNLAAQAETNLQRLADIYGKAGQSVYDFINANAEALGMSRSLAQGYAAIYGNLFSVFADQQTNARLTNDYLRATAVVASKTGRTVEDVVERIRSGLLGNTEAIEDLGIFVNIKTIEMTEAFARIADGRSWAQLNTYEQNQIRTLAILEQAANKFGTEVYNTNGLIRTQFTAAYKEFQATWGQVVNQVLMPILETLTYIFKALTAGLKTVFNLSDNAEGLFSKQANDILTAVDGQNALTAAVKNTTKEAKKSVAIFDELSILQSPAEDTAAGGVTQGTIGFETPLDDTNNNIETSVEQFDEMKEKLKAIAILVGAVGTSLLAWRISEFLTELKTSEELVRLLATQLKSVVGIFAIIGGSILQIQGYSDGWVNGIDWQNFIKNLGGAALVIAGIALAINPVAAAFVAVGEGIAFLVLGIKDFIDNGANFKNVLTIIIGLVTIFIGLMLLVGAPIAAVVTGIAALVAAFVILWNKSEGFRQFWIDLWENIKKTAVDVWGNYVKPVLDYIGDKFTDLWGNHIKPMWEDHLQPALIELGKKITELWSNVIRPVLSFIGGAIQKLWDNFLKPFIDSVLHVFVDGFRSAFDLIMDIFGTFFDSAGNTIDAVVEIFSGLIDFIVGVFTGDWEKAWNGVKDVFKGIVNRIITTFENGMNFIIDIVNGFLGKINSVVSAVGDIVGASWDIGLHLEPIKIPRLATGGIVPRATTALIGEAGREAVLPLENNTEWMYTLADIIASRNGNSGQPIVIELNGRELGRAVIEQGRRENNRVGASLKVT